VRIAVFGAGAVGSYFGGRLALAGADVHLIARGAHLKALGERGLLVRSIRGDFAASVPATDDPAEIGACDYVLVCVKAHDTERIAKRLAPLLHDETAVVTLQNGIDNEEKLAAAIGEKHVLGGAAYIFASLVEPGIVAHTAGAAAVVFGEIDASSSARGERLRELCAHAAIPAQLVADIRTRLWQKLAGVSGRVCFSLIGPLADDAAVQIGAGIRCRAWEPELGKGRRVASRFADDRKRLMPPPRRGRSARR
jgi:2-dehydropantoate 2-reductase